MSQSEKKVVQYLHEAYDMETGLVRELQAQIAMTPQGSYRAALEKHLRETRVHAERVQNRLRDLGERTTPIFAPLGIAGTVLSQTAVVWKLPLNLVRGTGGEEKLLKNAKDAYAAEALEIATYAALERLAGSLGDETTAKLAASNRAEDTRMLERIEREIPKLVDAVVRADVEGEPSYDVTKTGAADAVRAVGNEVKQTGRDANARARRTARQARKVPGVAQAEGQVKGAVASEKDLAITGYDGLTAEEIVGRLGELSQIDLAKIDSYERKNQNRTTVLSRITSLRGDEPWPGYDELNAGEVRTALSGADEDRVKAVQTYERAHKQRSGVLNVAEREAARS